MTRADAIYEAGHRWGIGSAKRKRDGTHQVLRAVRPLEFLLKFEVMGSGPTWEAAFTDADERETKHGR